MRIRIVCYEDVNEWILGKFALKLREILSNLGETVDIDKVPDPSADINHHIIYEQYNGHPSHNDTLMITHIDSAAKLRHLKSVIDKISMGICMSNDTMRTLKALGISKEKLCYINPAHDGDLTPKPIQIGFMSRWYADGRKRGHYLKRLINILDSKIFAFKIMGSGWDQLVEIMRIKGFNVEYYQNFDLMIYKRLMSEIDYYLYTGIDEGQMGFVDALASGVKTIVTPQGYHLDVPNGITHSFNNEKELLNIFNAIYKEKIDLIKSVETWSWKYYTLKHLEVWYHLVGKNVSLISEVKYNDGINSFSSSMAELAEIDRYSRLIRETNLFILGLRRLITRKYNYYTSMVFWKNVRRKLEISNR